MIVLLRHGSTDGNVAGAFLSTSDPPLNAQGRAQCARAAAALAGTRFDAALASPMRRAVESLAIVAPGAPRETHDALREVDFGHWEGKTIERLAEESPHDVARRREDPVHFTHPGGESFVDVARRLEPFVERVRALPAGSNVLIVAHRGTLGVLERLLRGLPLESRTVTPLEPGEYRVLD